jgi:ferredoxin
VKRNIITIDEEKCNGCGVCIPDCPEGALQIIDDKARLVSDLFCDGLGACIGSCPQGAITIEEREAEPYDECRVMENVVKYGENTIKAHLSHLKEHGEVKYLGQALQFLRDCDIDIPDDFTDNSNSCQNATGCCPGSSPLDLNAGSEAETSRVKLSSELRQWPVQLKLLNPIASYFDDADLLIAADCTAFAHGDFHRRFVRDKIVIMFCPKLDPYIDEYIEKLAAIFSTHEIKSITIARMEVPCCGGVGMIIQRALEKAGKNIFVKDYTISVDGEIV